MNVFTPEQWFEIAKETSSQQGIGLIPIPEINEMVDRRDDLEHQLGICRPMMTAGELLPYPFERAVILLSKAKRFQEEAEICAYVKDWAERYQAGWDGRSAREWMSPRVNRMIARLPKAEAKAVAQNSGRSGNDER